VSHLDETDIQKLKERWLQAGRPPALPIEDSEVAHYRFNVYPGLGTVYVIRSEVIGNFEVQS
jgi:hypothetical protein